MAGVRLGQGATVVLRACNTGRGDIRAEGVVGLARGFLLANAAAAVVSLWSVSSPSSSISHHSHTHSKLKRPLLAYWACASQPPESEKEQRGRH
jgi:hypothetical protein